MNLDIPFLVHIDWKNSMWLKLKYKMDIAYHVEQSNI